MSEGILSFTNMEGTTIADVPLGASIIGPSGPQGPKGDPGSGTTTPPLNEQFFMLPDIYIAVGETQEIYYSSILHCANLANYTVTITGDAAVSPKDNFKPMSRQLQVIATAAVVGTHAFQVIIIDQYGIIAHQAPFNIHIVAKETAIPATLKFMFIGDSTVDQKVLQGFESRANAIYGATGILNFVGMAGTAPYQHEGHPGWSARSFVGDMGAGANPFWNDSTKKLDFKNYTTVTGIKPDAVYYKIGTNDAYYNYTTDSFAESVKKFIDQMRLDWGNELPIYMSLMPMFGTQDGLGYNYGVSPGKDRASINKSVKNHTTKLYEALSSYQKLYFVPNLFCFDSDYNYSMITTKVNPFSTATELRMNGGTHPDAAGCAQEASILFGRWLGGHKSSAPVPMPTVTLTNLVGNAAMTTLNGWAAGLSPMGVAEKLGSEAGTIEIHTATAGTLAMNVGITWASGINIPDEVFPGHIYYMREKVKAITLPPTAVQANTGVIFFPFGNTATGLRGPIPIGSYDLFSTLVTNTKTGAPATTQTALRMGSPAIDITGMDIAIKEPMLIDLTQGFGAGKEPTKAWCDANIPFFVGSRPINV